MTIDERSPFFETSISAFARIIDRAAAGQIGLLDAVPPDDVAAGGEVGPWHEFEQLALLLGKRRRLVGLDAVRSSR